MSFLAHRWLDASYIRGHLTASRCLPAFESSSPRPGSTIYLNHSSTNRPLLDPSRPDVQCRKQFTQVVALWLPFLRSRAGVLKSNNIPCRHARVKLPIPSLRRLLELASSTRYAQCVDTQLTLAQTTWRATFGGEGTPLYELVTNGITRGLKQTAVEAAATTCPPPESTAGSGNAGAGGGGGSGGTSGVLAPV